MGWGIGVIGSDYCATMIRIRVVLLPVLLLATAAGCSCAGSTGAPPAVAATSKAALDAPGLTGCRNIAILARDRDLDREGNQLSGSAALGSANADVAAAGRVLLKAALGTVAPKPDEAEKAKGDLLEAQQGLLRACTAVLGEQPWQ